jgi:glycosyltransferase involved in cell wall biosynthesis
MSRITVITAGHLSTCPRMLKAAESLAADGHEVYVVSTNFVGWGTEGDVDLRARLRLPWNVVDYSRATGNRLRIRAGVRHRVCRALGQTFGAERLPAAVLGCATTRVLPELVQAAAEIPSDLVYGGGGALIATALAAKRLNVPYAIDLEDFHGAEHAAMESEGVFSNRLAQAAETIMFRDAAFLTTASDAIADRYARTYGKRPLLINNTFPLPAREPEFTPVDGAGLRLYWFSQTIGPGRGLEDAVQAAGLAEINCELHLLGNSRGDYFERLLLMAKERAPRLRLVHHAPQPPDRMVDLCRDYHVGLALERAEPLNRALALSNKAFTYILAGLAVVFTDTPGQRGLAMDLGPGAFLYSTGDIEKLAQGLKLWAENPAQLLAARRAAWAAARRRWHWQHPEEEGALLRAVRQVLR